MANINNPHQNGHVEPDMFDIGGALRLVVDAVRFHRLLVGITTLITLGIVVLYVVVWPPIYKVEAQLAAERDLDPSRDQFYASWQVFRKEDPRDELQLFTAGPILRRLIDENDLKYNDVYHPFLSHASYLWEESWLGRNYQAFKRWVMPSDELEASEAQKDFGRTVEGLKAGISITGAGDSNVATVEVKGPTPEIYRVANSLIQYYLEDRKNRHKGEAEVAHKVLTQEVARARAELDVAQKLREKFAGEHGLLLDFQKETQDVEELTAVEVSVSNHRAKLAALEASFAEVEQRLKSEAPEKVIAAVTEMNMVRDAARLKKLEQQTGLIQLRSKYREDSPEVQEVVDHIAKLDELIAGEPERIERSVTRGVNPIYQQLMSSRVDLLSEIEGERAALFVQERTAATMRGRLQVLPAVTGNFVDVLRNYETIKEKHQRLLFKQMEAEVSAAAVEAAPGTVRVVDFAVPPTSKYWPRLKYLYPGALLAGLALGVLAAVLRSLTSGLLMRTDVESGKIAAPVYASIELGQPARSLKVVSRQPDSPVLPERRKSGKRSTRSTGT